MLNDKILTPSVKQSHESKVQNGKIDFTLEDLNYLQKMIDIFPKSCLETKDVNWGMYFCHRIECILNYLICDFLVVFP